MMRLLLPLLGLLLGACASAPPIDAGGAREGLSAETVAEAGPVFDGERVLWGGRIVEVRNEAEDTVIEILDYPLDSGQRPDTDATAGARFLVVQPGFLDPVDYAAGRLLTALGTLTPSRTARAGDAERVLPVVEAEALELWPPPRADAEWRSRPRVNFGFGIIIGR